MGKRRRKFRKPRHQMKPVYDWGGGKDMPLNRGKVAELNQDPKQGPLDMNTSTPNLHQGASRLMYPEPSPFGFVRPPSKLKEERNFVPTRFQGTPAGRHETELRGKKLSMRVEPMFQFLFKGEYRQVRLWYTPGGRECVIVETDTLVRYRKESIPYTSRSLAETMYQLNKVSWEKTELLPEPKAV